ncbi:MAG: type II toxin-antitoxin system PemK/MazF family toxin [Candidatus Cloacimonetes bacterium]|nr:type II toxin-antitoxin system PemK/MazF family toxin [Candidatus Cloacimonadota bacterium]
MRNLKKGMIVSVDLNPVKGSETGKVRPCVIVTNDVYNKNPYLPVIQVVPITEWSNKKEKIVTNVTIEKNAKNGLDKKSVADCLQTRPVDINARLKKILGVITDEEMDKMNQALITLFELG